MLDEQLIADAKIPGLRPTQQQRSRELVVRLMNDGLALLKDQDFDGLSIEALCSRSGTTVGSFYARFESKDAFIDALQRLVVEGRRRELALLYASDRVPRDNLGHLLNWITKGGIIWVRQHEGLVRASLRRAGSDRQSWTPMRELGRLQVEHALPIVASLVAARRNGVKHVSVQGVVEALVFGTQLSKGPQRIVIAVAHDLAKAAVLVREDGPNRHIQQHQTDDQHPQQTEPAHGYLICRARNCQADRL